MNILQALSGITELSGASPSRVFSRPPATPPSGCYAVVTDLRDETEAKQDFDATETTVLVTVYGGEETTEAALLPLFNKVKALTRFITSHPGVNSVVATRPSSWRPTWDNAIHRPWCGVRFALKYREMENA